jgi:hypothetical protein
MLIPLIVMSILTWLVFQTVKEENNLKWKRRMDPIRPVARTIKEDIRVTRQYCRGWWQQRREMRHTSIPDDLSDM